MPIRYKMLLRRREARLHADRDGEDAASQALRRSARLEASSVICTAHLILFHQEFVQHPPEMKTKVDSMLLRPPQAPETVAAKLSTALPTRFLHLTDPVTISTRPIDTKRLRQSMYSVSIECVEVS